MITTVCLVDGGSGNLRSVQKALEHVGARVVVSSDPATLPEADKLVLPGVGMQVLFEAGEELGEQAGLGLLPGRVRALAAPGLPVPHTGWNQLEPAPGDSPLLRGLAPSAYAYFNHGYCCAAEAADTLAITEYGERFVSVVGRGRLYGIQCHPEKSQQVGLALLRNFVEHG